MSELVAGRIVRHAERLKLSHLTETAEQLRQRGEDAQLGYREFRDLVLDEEVAVRESRRFDALKLSGLPHRKAWTSSTSRSNPTWTHARSKTSPP